MKSVVSVACSFENENRAGIRVHGLTNIAQIKVLRTDQSLESEAAACVEFSQDEREWWETAKVC